MRRKLQSHEYFHTYYFKQGDDGRWNVWFSNRFRIPYVVASFPTEFEARQHAIRLNDYALREPGGTYQAVTSGPPEPHL